MKKEIFNAASLKLEQGINLVEASAGTGKTFAIAMLVLRFITEKEIPLEKILIVTFTKAAAKELRGRIRNRLIEARDILECSDDKQQWQQFDPPLREWCEQIVAQDKRQRARLLLQAALYRIDQAPVFTIHGFCQRMLGEQALESNQPFDCELLGDIDRVKREIAEDYWRSLFYRKDGEIETVLFADGRFAGPMELLLSINQAEEGIETAPEGRNLVEYEKELVQSFKDIRHWWSERGALFRQKILDAVDNDKFKTKLDGVEWIGWQKWVSRLENWCRNENAPFFICPELLVKKNLMGNLNGNKFRKTKLLQTEERKEHFVADWPFYPKAEELIERLDNLVLFHRVDFARFLQQELARRLARQGYMSHNSSIFTLANILRKEPKGQLQSALAGRFDAALIDEFQDTDSWQYRIFSTIFGGGDKYLYLIGDPKQAIYSFRGADIHSYFAARQEASRLLTLDTNYRSHPLLIEEINRLFQGRQKPFFYDESILPFSPVKARTEEYAELVTVGKEPASGMVYWVLPPDESKGDKRWSKGDAQELLLQHTVKEIGSLLAKGSYYISEEGEKKPLLPQDIAVLVRGNKTAEAYANALADKGIPAVVNGRSSVFSSDECRELLLLLSAILAPNRLDKVKAALALSWFGRNGEDIYKISRDESRMGGHQFSLMEYARQWHENGFFSMMVTLMQKEGVWARLAEGMRGERHIANIRQLFGVIEEEALARNLLPQELYQWLLRQYNGAGDVEESELLLESDRDAVKIVTMHSAKGLEYGVVFCVDLWGGTDWLVKEKNQILCRENGELLVDLGSESFDRHREEARQELWAEDLRLLYVALTRAKMRCYLAWADVKGWNGPYFSNIDSFVSPLGYLLFPGQEAAVCDDLCQQKRISGLTSKERGVFMRILQDVPATAVFDFSSSAIKLQKSELRRQGFSSLWRLSSFSSLADLSEYGLEITKKSQEGGEGAQIAVMGLPAGARFGSAVHDILEKNSFSQLAKADETCVKRCAEIACRYGIDSDPANPAQIAKLVQQAVTAPLVDRNGNRFCLEQLEENDCLKEMPFHLLHNAVKTDEICRVLTDDPVVVPLSVKEFKGYLTGFVDLVCKWQGRYYILDYKTNNLGDSLVDYQGERLQAAMCSHNYGLQYWLYTVALHRYLEKMEKDYDYSQHFGGVFYLFVRGMIAGSSDSGIYFAAPPADTVRELDSLLGGKK